MGKWFESRVFGLIACVIAVLCLSACDLFTSLTGPEHRFILQADNIDRANVSGKAYPSDELVQQSAEVLVGRLESTGIYVHNVTSLGRGRVRLETSGRYAPQVLEDMLSHVDQVDFRIVDGTVLPQDVENGVVPFGTKILPQENGEGPVAVRRLGGLTSQNVVAAQKIYDTNNGGPAVAIQFDETGGKRLHSFTKAHVGEQMAIIFNESVVAAPIIESPIQGGQLQIAGSFTEEQADKLAMIFRSGPLPVDFRIIEIRNLD